MADKKFKKRNFIEISSTDESESSRPESDDDAVEEISSSTSCNDDDDEDEEEDGSEWNDSEDEEEDEAQVDEDEDCDDAHVEKDDAESMCNKVIQFIREGSDLQELKVVECKAYLRRHGLRLSGTKGDCIERIKEHWRLKDGNGEAFYPRSSFIIDCTGDVCKGDVVLFNQKVYQIVDKMTRSRSLLRRTVAGRIVKESYGAARQQHTFTVEVLWSKGAEKLDPLFPLLVKGRNLYKLKTYRQRWENEKERFEVLAEKHKRGAAARTTRAMRKTKVVTKTSKSLTYTGAKRCKHFHHVGPSGTRETTHEKKNCLNEHGKALAKNKKWSPYLSFAPFQTSSPKQNGGLRGPASSRRHQNLIQSTQVREPPCFPYNYPSQTFYHIRSDVFQREQHHFSSHRGSASMARLPYSHPLPNSVLKPNSEWKEFSHGSSIDLGYSRNVHEPRDFYCFPRLMDNHPSIYSSTTDTHRWR
ncbi:hypothetical protein Pfo_008712 [Paulownia fortunei]|nr:hypothetical protein Pfo_008712 [Paulownia fortunei]